jgi:DNA-binding response OmpR family regulator
MSNILLLEDDEDLAQVLSQWLDSEDISLEVCHDGHEGYARLMKGHYDLVILDWSLPGLSGLEICQKYRSIQGSTPFLMLSGRSAIVDITRCLDAGVDDYLVKPFNPRELSARIKALTRRAAGNVWGQLHQSVCQDPIATHD